MFISSIAIPHSSLENGFIWKFLSDADPMQPARKWIATHKKYICLCVCLEGNNGQQQHDREKAHYIIAC